MGIIKARWILGGVLVLVGACFLLRAFGIPDAYDWLAKGWPLILIVIGLSHILAGEIYGGLLWVVVGFVVGLITTGLVSYSGSRWQIIWPILAILVGLRFLVRPARRAGRVWRGNGRAAPSAVFSERQQQESSQDFRGTNMRATFGSAKLDLREAKIAASGAIIDVSVVFGAIEILAPAATPVRSDLHSVFADYTDHRSPAAIDESLPAITLRGDVTFGAVEVKD